MGRDHGLSLLCSGCGLVLFGWSDWWLVLGVWVVCLSFARCVGLFIMVCLPVGMWLLLFRADALLLS